MTDTRNAEIVFLGKAAEDLSNLIERQCRVVFTEHGIVMPVKSCSLINFLRDCESASASDIAKGLGQSHQLILQKIPALMKLKLISCRADPNDQRRKQYRLTAKGHQQAEKWSELASQTATVYQGIFQELGIDLHAAIKTFTESLEETDLLSRMNGLSTRT